MAENGPARPSEAKLPGHHFVDHGRIGLAAGSLQDLTGEPANELGIDLGLFRLFGVGRDQSVQSPLNLSGLFGMLHHARSGDFSRNTPFGPKDLEQVLGHLARDFA